jgi:hypothetical protein
MTCPEKDMHRAGLAARICMWLALACVPVFLIAIAMYLGEH